MDGKGKGIEGIEFLQINRVNASSDIGEGRRVEPTIPLPPGRFLRRDGFPSFCSVISEYIYWFEREILFVYLQFALTFKFFLKLIERYK